MSAPTFAAATAASDKLVIAQKPFHRKFAKCGTLDALGAMLAKEGHVKDVPWVSWIVDGPTPSRAESEEGIQLRWTGSSDEPDAALQNQLFALVSKLIEDGADLLLEDSNGHHDACALARLVTFDEVTSDQRTKLLALAIRKGADPAARIEYPVFEREDGPCLGFVASPSALDAALQIADDHPELFAALRSHVSAGALEDAYLRRVIDQLSTWSTEPGWLDSVVALASHAGDLHRTITRPRGNETGALVHFLCEAEARIEYFDHFAASLDPNAPLPAPFPFQTLVAVKWGITPTLTFEPGATPLDLVDGILGFVKRAQAQPKQKEFRADAAEKFREALEAKRAKLVARGAVSKQPHDVKLPPLLAETAEQLVRIATMLGHDDAAIRAAIEDVDTSGMGAWGFLSEIVPACAGQLLSPRLHAEPLLGHTLGAFVDKGADDVAEFTGEQWSTSFPKTRLPVAARSKVKKALVFHDDGTAQYLVILTARGSEIWKLEADEVEKLAPTIPKFLELEIDRWAAAEKR